MHLRDYLATTSAIVAELPVDREQPVRVWVALGNPCASIFVPGFLPEAIPSALAEVTTAARFAALSRSVEGENGLARLEQIRSVLNPLESELWRGADDLAARGDAADGGRGHWFVDAAWSRVDDALASLGA
jgi:hypothetical protein